MSDSEEEFIHCGSPDLDIVYLLQLVKSNPSLYEKKDKDYYDLGKKQLIWENIAKTMHTSSHVCEEKFQYLRRKFVRVRKAFEHRTKNSVGPVDPPTWQWWNEMQFMWNHIQVRSCTSRYARNSKVSKISPIDFVQIDHNNLDIYPKIEIDENIINSKRKSDDRTIEESPYIEWPKKARVSQPVSPFDEEIICTNCNAAVLRRKRPKSHETQNEDELFVKLIAAELGKITDDEKKKKMKEHIFSYIMFP